MTTPSTVGTSELIITHESDLSICHFSVTAEFSLVKTALAQSSMRVHPWAVCQKYRPKICSLVSGVFSHSLCPSSMDGVSLLSCSVVGLLKDQLGKGPGPQDFQGVPGGQSLYLKWPLHISKCKTNVQLCGAQNDHKGTQITTNTHNTTRKRHTNLQPDTKWLQIDTNDYKYGQT